MACVLPGAHSPEELWQNVLAGRRHFRKAPPERLPPDYFDANPEAPGKSYCNQMAVISDWSFDPIEFRIPPVTFQVSDLAHWLALFTAREAIRNSGLKLDALNRTRAGVILGNSLTGEFSRSHNLRLRWPYVERSIRRALGQNVRDAAQAEALVAAIRQVYESPLPEITEDTLAGNMANTIAGRVCNYFDLGAGGFTIDGACSSSLLAVAMACNSLANGEMDVALTGGVDVSLDPFEIVGFAKTQALARDDIRPYDARAAGMLTGEGCGVIVLAREADARAAGYPIHAVIRGWGYSSDGTGGITAPEVEGQMRALRAAYRRAGYSIGSVGLIEGHGTGTALGDKVELTAIQRMLAESPGDSACRIGSIKGNIGHCKAAAGIAGLIKAVMALKRKVLPPTVNCEKPNALFRQSQGRLRPSLHGQAWETSSGSAATDSGGHRGELQPAPRRASVSSLGFGGSNSHITLEEANPQDSASPEDLALLGSRQTTELVLLAADTVEDLAQQVNTLIPVAKRICRAELTDLAAALAKTSPRGCWRLAIVAESPWHLADILTQLSLKLAEGNKIEDLDDPQAGVFAGKAQTAPTWVALFPGQGSQRLNMGEHLRRRYPFVQELYDLAAEFVRSECIFRDVSAAEEAARKSWEAELRDTRVAQPAIVLTSLAALRVLEFLGLKPAASIGHSLGEISALHAAGACKATAAVKIAALRGQAMSSLELKDPGAMLAIAAQPEAVEELIHAASPHPHLSGNGNSLVISNFNSPRQTVASGSTGAISRLHALCEEKKVRCQRIPVSHAFHSDIVAPAATAFRAALEAAPLQALSAVAISTSTGRVVPADANVRELLGQQIRRPVRFLEAVEHAAERKPSLWLEVGPGGVLTSFVRDILGPDAAPCFPTDVPGEDGFHLLNQALARAFVLGFPLMTDRLFAHRFHRPLDPANYHPVFIVNPCERPVDLPADSLDLDAASFGITTPVGPAAAKSGTRSGTHEGLPAGDESSTDKDALLAFAVDWISKRTGFPKNAIAPEKRLRDDLNLDSIKVGELVILMTRKIKRTPKADPATLSNVSLTQLVEALLQDGETPAAQPQMAETRKIDLQPVASLDRWIRSYPLVPVPAPIAAEPSRPWPASGSVAIVAEADSPRAGALGELVRNKGLTPVILDLEKFPKRGSASAELAALVVVLPECGTSFLDSALEEFDRRVEGLAATVFHIFRWALRVQEGNGHALRGLVLRPTACPADAAVDLDAGAGFLKSLMLEHPNASLKWIALPGQWSFEQWAAIVEQELATAGRVAVAYAEDGVRTTEVALPIVPAMNALSASRRQNPGVALPASIELGPDDVVLVSGGAKGITFELALGLARQTKVKLALLGSSGLTEASADVNGGEMARNFERLRSEGIRYFYAKADVSDAEAVRQAVAQAERELGTITALLHGAGITQLRSFRDKDLESFLHCIRVKVRGLYNLLVAVPPQQIKALHVISSVLGHTGMRGQADYTFANAWLDGAVKNLKARHPHLHCLSLGFTAWAETGLAKKVGAVDPLRSLGVTPINVDEGVAAYLDLAQKPQAQSQFVIAGRLTTDLEANLFRPPGSPRGRFLEKVQRWVPGTELVADALVSHRTDLYLPEHVFEGTPMYPGVMAIEAMVQAAMACAGRDDLPVMRHIQFRRPLIVPEDATFVVRSLALAEVAEGGAVRVRTAMRSNSDDFQQNHFEAECWFGLPAVPAQELPVCPPMPERLDVDPEDFCPAPLFQGKFFRRIAAIRKMVQDSESLTDLIMPDGERYFSREFDPVVATPSPALNDAFFQSGALVLPPGCLPMSIGEVRLHKKAVPHELLHCHILVREKTQIGYVVDCAVFNLRGELVETMRNIVLREPRSGIRLTAQEGAPITPASRASSDLESLLPDFPHALAMVNHEEVKQPETIAELAPPDIGRIKTGVPEARQVSALANLVATRRAAKTFAMRYRGLHLLPAQVQLAHRADGKPELRFENPSLSEAFQGIDVTLTDGAGQSLAVIGPAPVGVDVEAVERRDAETWRGLLGDDGYALALRLAAWTTEPFDRAATRVWTLLEAGKKANSLKRIVPGYTGSRGGSWLSFSTGSNGASLDFLSATLSHPQAARGALVLTLAFGGRAGPTPSGGPPQPGRHLNEFQSVVSAFRAELERFRIDCAGDPMAPGTEERHERFLALIKAVTQKLVSLEKKVGDAELITLRQTFQKMLLEFLDGSENFRHTLVKPFGYAGDFKLLEMLANNRCASQGLAYHFDRSQLEYPASEACRKRIEWILNELVERTKAKPHQRLTILDLGVGAAPIEQRLARLCPAAPLELIAVDLEPRALDYVVQTLQDGPRVVRPCRINLRDQSATCRVAELARSADVCIAVGILEALRDEEAVRLLDALRQALPVGAVLFAENFLANHPNQKTMEWFMDFHLACRSVQQIEKLAAEGGFAADQFRVTTDATDSLALLRATR